MKNLDVKEAAFVSYVLGGKNYTDAAALAGWSAATSKQKGSEVARRPHVAEALKGGLAKIAQRIESAAGVNLESLIRELLLNLEVAKAKGQTAVVNATVELLAKLTGNLGPNRGKADDGEESPVVTIEVRLTNVFLDDQAADRRINP